MTREMTREDRIRAAAQYARTLAEEGGLRGVHPVTARGPKAVPIQHPLQAPRPRRENDG